MAEPDIMQTLEALVESTDQVVTNTEILMFISGWQGGTVHQIAEHLGVSITAIMLADYEDMQRLMRLAQQKSEMKK